MQAVKLAAVLVVAGIVAAGCGGSASHDAAELQSTYESFRSAPRVQPPRLVVQKAEGGTAPGYIFIAPKRGKIEGPEIVDDSGNVVWFHPVQPDDASDFRVQTYDGKRVLTWWEGPKPVSGLRKGRYEIYDTSYRKVTELKSPNPNVAYDLHEFQLTPKGTALVTAYALARAQVAGKRGWVLDSIVYELDVASHRVVFAWHSLPHVPVADSELPAPSKTSQTTPFDYFHVNSVALDADGNFLVSARNTSAVYKVRRSDGKILWQLGGKHDDFRLGPGASFHWQHDVKREPDGTITVFDNEALPARAKFSRALVLDVDEAARTATLVRAYDQPAQLLSPHQGNVQELPNGNVFVGWGGIPYLTEFTREGRAIFDAKIVVGDTYRAYRFPWVGHPVDAPAVSVANGVAYASWNGATQVAQWVLLAGSKRDALQASPGTPKDGFETAIPVHGHPKYVAVRALDAHGKVLGTSRVVAQS